MSGYYDFGSKGAPARQCPACDAAYPLTGVRRPRPPDHYPECPLGDVPLKLVAGLSLEAALAEAGRWRAEHGER
ncbi:hypothetical protein [Streptomyces sp. JB150]|uniref:hypothetical protein n=1 Tax=Streptomyces sp. JB150 TaxID=2714844 RepID=UPI00140CB750|nr:hypothetical protein [Streptomyces sp. JB150]QIJ65391.1 hypothetical protein G7Z13_27650 [Streptomyces sp. JB150]